MLAFFFAASLALVQQSPYEYFELDHTVQLSTEVLLSGIRSLEVAVNGDMLVYDQRHRAVALFDAYGSLIKNLDPTPCHPGFNMMPTGAVYVGSGIFMMNSGPWGYRFDKKGRCVGPVDETFRPTALHAGTVGGEIWGFYGSQGRIVRMDSLGGTISSFSAPPTEFAEMRDHVSEGELIVHSDTVYFASPIDFRIYRYLLDGEPVSAIGTEPPGYRRPPADYPEQSSVQRLDSIGKILLSTSVTSGLDLLDKNLLMIQIRNPRESVRYFVYSEEGSLLAAGQASDLSRPFHFAARGLAYHVATPEREDPDAEPVNPTVEVYRYVGPGSRGN